MFPLTCVSGYWDIKNKHGNSFNKWFENTLKINCPYVFFSDKETIEIIRKYREGLPTYYIELDIKDFYTYQFKYRMITHNIHCPNVELNLIWNEKIFLIKIAFDLNIFESDYFMWIDAGVCVFRNTSPPSYSFPNINKLSKLPKDKFIYSSSSSFDENLFTRRRYHLHHHVSGTTYILHKNIIEKFVQLYKEYLNLIDKTDIWTDQVIWTHIYKNNKNIFHKLIDGYGKIINKLY